MATYNDADSLASTLDSVLAQEFTDLRLIVVNDGSTDPRVSEILCSYCEKDDRIDRLDQCKEGLTLALIRACDAARGDYIARIDVGDIMLPGRLATQARVLDAHADCAFVSCWTELCGPEWEPMWLVQGAPSSNKPVAILPDQPGQGLLGDVPHHGSVMIRRSAYQRAGGYRPQFYFGQDWDLWYRLAEQGKYCVVPQVLYRARFFPGSISMTRKRFQDEIASYSKGAFLARRLGQDESEWLHRANACRPATEGSNGARPKTNQAPGLYFIGEALRRRGDPRARHYFAKAIRQDPASPRAYLRWMQSWSRARLESV